MIRIALVALCLAFSAPAAAQAPLPSEGEPVYVHTIVCDTADQVREIVEANIAGGSQAAGAAIFLHYLETMNDKNEPICALGEYAGVLVDTIPLGDSPGANGTIYPTYALGVKHREVTYYYVLWYDSGDPVPPGGDA